jgi:hypothetical protein
MATTTNYGWTTPNDTDLVKDGAAAIRTLGSSIDTTTKNLNPQTTTGALAYRSATANVNTALPIGSTGQVLTVAAGVPSWASPAGAPGFVGCSLFDTNPTQSIASGTNVALTWDSESFDTDGFHSTSSNTSRITIPAGKGGKYLFNGFSHYAANATGVRLAKLFKNGAELFESNFNKGDGTNFTVINISAIIDLVPTDYIEFVTLQNSGGNLNAYKNNAPFYGWFSAQFLGA